MSATPIPRTVMLTVFGDLDLSLITELPAGRRSIDTRVVPPQGRKDAYEFIRSEIRRGRQAFVICPRIEKRDPNDPHTSEASENNRSFGPFGSRSQHSDRVDTRSVKEEFEKLSQTVFPELRVGMLHGQQKAKDKERVMSEFRDGRTDILVSTSVIEVGVDVPNATIMMIEGADRFGLAQLYQFRGRVGRGEHQSYCLLFTDSDSKATTDRLKAVLRAKNGFELAEYDLRLRGPGEFLGDKQTGLPDYAMRGLQDPELVKSARAAALGTLKDSPTLARHPALKVKLAEFERRMHRE